jgi:hypothetical protein
MADQDEATRIRAYLEQHLATYHRDVLREKLIEDGHDAAVVDRVLAEVAGPQPVAQIGISRQMQLLMAVTAVGVVVLNSSVCFRLFRSGDPIMIALLVAVELMAMVVLWRDRSTLAASVLIGLLLWIIGTVIFIASFIGLF